MLKCLPSASLQLFRRIATYETITTITINHELSLKNSTQPFSAKNMENFSFFLLLFLSLKMTKKLN